MFPLMLRYSLFFLLRPKCIIWSFDGLVLMPLTLYHSNNPCRSLFNVMITESKFVSHEQIVV